MHNSKILILMSSPFLGRRLDLIFDANFLNLSTLSANILRYNHSSYSCKSHKKADLQYLLKTDTYFKTSSNLLLRTERKRSHIKRPSKLLQQRTKHWQTVIPLVLFGKKPKFSHVPESTRMLKPFNTHKYVRKIWKGKIRFKVLI